MGDGDKEENKESIGVLHFLSGPDEKMPLKVLASAILGREKGDILILDGGISSSHCQIQKVGEDYYIYDMNSSNGTYVNGQRIRKEKLSHQDEVEIGATKIRFDIISVREARKISTSTQKSWEEEERTKLASTRLGLSSENDEKWMIILKVVYPDGKKEVLPLAGSEVILGRGSTFGSFDNDPGISRRHLRIKVNDHGEIFVEDLESTNGSFLGGQKMHGIHKMVAEEELQIGGTKISITARSAGETAVK